MKEYIFGIRPRKEVKRGPAGSECRVDVLPRQARGRQPIAFTKMKKEEVPQDKSALSDFTREVCYVKNADGKYETALSTGWEVKAVALDKAWDEVKERIGEAREAVARGEKSPVHYFMALNLMDMPVIADYTGFWPFFIRRHLRPGVFRRLSRRKLEKYARAFGITVDELKNFKG